MQPTGSFKERGAVTKLDGLDADERRRGVIAMSAGNHAQAVAYHARRLGIPATIVMPLATPLVKVENTRSHGARVVLHGDNLSESGEQGAARSPRRTASSSSTPTTIRRSWPARARWPWRCSPTRRTSTPSSCRSAAAG